MSKQGYVYAFFHPQASKEREGFVRVKFGESGSHPWGSLHEQRGEKLAFGFDLFGFDRPQDFFEPFETHDCKAAEKFLIAHCRRHGWSIGRQSRGRSSEVFLVPEAEASKLRGLLEANF